MESPPSTQEVLTTGQLDPPRDEAMDNADRALQD